MWTTVDIEKKLNKRWNAAAGLEYRSQNGLSLTDQIRGSLGAEYNPKKIPFKFGVNYTLIANKKQKKDIFVIRHRFTCSATGSYKFDRFTASWRPRLQATFYDEKDKKPDVMDDYRWVVRNRFGLKYNVRKLPLKPYVQFEIFNRIFSDITPSYYKNRLSAGIEIGIGKRHTLDFGYKRDSELDNGKKYLFYAVTVGYTFAF